MASRRISLSNLLRDGNNDELLFTKKVSNILIKRFPYPCDFSFFKNSDFNTTITLHDIELIHQVAKGSYGVVYKGLVKSKEYAIKIVECGSDTIEQQVNVLSELTVLQSINHDRLVKFYGACMITKSDLQAKVSVLIFLNINNMK